MKKLFLVLIIFYFFWISCGQVIGPQYERSIIGKVINQDGEPVTGALINLTYYFSYRYSLEFSVGSVGLAVESTPTGGTPFDFGEVNQMPIQLTIRRHFRTDGMTSPYIGVGVGQRFSKDWPERKLA